MLNQVKPSENLGVSPGSWYRTGYTVNSRCDPEAFHIGAMVTQSDAKLVASAKEMYDALCETLAWLESGRAVDNGALCETESEAIDAAKAALTKAGRSVKERAK